MPGFGNIKRASESIRTLPLILPLVNRVLSRNHITVEGHGVPVVKQHRKQKGLFSGTGYDISLKKLTEIPLEGHC